MDPIGRLSIDGLPIELDYNTDSKHLFFHFLGICGCASIWLDGRQSNLKTIFGYQRPTNDNYHRLTRSHSMLLFCKQDTISPNEHFLFEKPHLEMKSSLVKNAKIIDHNTFIMEYDFME